MLVHLLTPPVHNTTIVEKEEQIGLGTKLPEGRETSFSEGSYKMADDRAWWSLALMVGFRLMATSLAAGKTILSSSCVHIKLNYSM